MFRVDSEVGRLRQVILHRPDLELKRLTPDNAADLLFDDVLWVSRAQQEHDAFADVLRSRGAVVHYYSDLLAQTLDITAARDYVLDGVFDSRWHGPLACGQLRAAVDGLDSVTLAGYLVGGITKREISELAPEPKSIAFHSLDPDGFVLVPLPNLLYQRDTSCWIYSGVSINAMRRQARVRESLFAEAIYRWHPMFAGAGFRRLVPRRRRGPGHHRGRRRAGDRQRRGARRDERADHAAGAGDAGAPAVRGRRRHLPGRHRHAEAAGVHAPGHHADHGGPRRVHQVRRDGDAARPTPSSRARARAS